MMTEHAMQRLYQRLNAGDARLVYSKAKDIAKMKANLDAAIRIVRLKNACGETDTHRDLYQRDSNGTDLWAIYRNSHLVTLMWRRPEQPETHKVFGNERDGDVKAIYHVINGRIVRMNEKKGWVIR